MRRLSGETCASWCTGSQTTRLTQDALPRTGSRDGVRDGCCSVAARRGGIPETKLPHGCWEISALPPTTNTHTHTSLGFARFAAAETRLTGTLAIYEEGVFSEENSVLRVKGSGEDGWIVRDGGMKVWRHFQLSLTISDRIQVMERTFSPLC